MPLVSQCHGSLKGAARCPSLGTEGAASKPLPALERDIHGGLSKPDLDSRKINCSVQVRELLGLSRGSL